MDRLTFASTPWLAAFIGYVADRPEPDAGQAGPEQYTREPAESLNRAVTEISTDLRAGLVQKRRMQVATDDGKVIADEVLTVPKIIDALLRAEVGSAARAGATARVRRCGPPAREGPVAGRAEHRQHALPVQGRGARRAIEVAPRTMLSALTYATQALAVEQTVVSAMLALTRWSSSRCRGRRSSGTRGS